MHSHSKCDENTYSAEYLCGVTLSDFYAPQVLVTPDDETRLTGVDTVSSSKLIRFNL